MVVRYGKKKYDTVPKFDFYRILQFCHRNTVKYDTVYGTVQKNWGHRPSF